MSFTPAGKRVMLNGASPSTMRLHTDYPGATGANEVSGGAPAYAAKSCAYGVSVSGESRQLTAAVVFDVPAASIEWASVWQGSEMLFIAPTAGSPKEFSSDLATNTIRCPSHGLADNDQIVFFLDTPPAPLVAGTKYYVITSATDDFQVSATLGGSAINLTAQAESGCLVSKISPRIYAAQDTHTVATFPFGLPN